MPRITNIELMMQNEQHTITIRTRTAVQNLPQFIGESYGRMGAYLSENGGYLSEVPFVAYHNMDMQDLDVEAGFPVATALEGRDEIKSGIIPAGLIVFCIYRGPYDGIGPVYEEMAEWISKNGLIPSGSAYECYYNGPEFPPEELLTKIVMPVHKA